MPERLKIIIASIAFFLWVPCRGSCSSTAQNSRSFLVAEESLCHPISMLGRRARLTVSSHYTSSFYASKDKHSLEWEENVILFQMSCDIHTGLFPLQRHWPHRSETPLVMLRNFPISQNNVSTSESQVKTFLSALWTHSCWFLTSVHTKKRR